MTWDSRSLHAGIGKRTSKCAIIAWIGAEEDTAGRRVKEQCREGERRSLFHVTKENLSDVYFGTKVSRG